MFICQFLQQSFGLKQSLLYKSNIKYFVKYLGSVKKDVNNDSEVLKRLDKFPFLFCIINSKTDQCQMNFQDYGYEKKQLCYHYDVVSTEGESSDGSEQSFPCVPTVAKYKTEPCKNFSLLGYCSYGDKCQFAHGTYDLNSTYCGNLYKTKKCKNFWRKGFCLYGVRCQFLHSECQRRPSQSNVIEYLRQKKSSYLDFTTQSRVLATL